MHDLNIPRQLFISVSPLLIESTKLEFDRLVYTFHSAYDNEIDRPEHTGCTFVSFVDLLFQLDNQIQPQRRLFYAKGSSRRIICQNSDDEDEEHDLPQRALYTAHDIVDFNRFCRLYYPRFSDEVRKVFAPEFIFTQIMFVIKGGNQTDYAGALSLKKYLTKNETCSGLDKISDSQRKLLYDAYRCYETCRLKLHHIDYPDIIANIVSRRGQSVAPVDFIYVDEVQDLMPCHWRLLDLFRHHKTQFVCCGDQAQCITAGNRFRFSKLKSFLFDSSDAQGIRPLQIDLTINYRTIQEVLGLANRILDIIRYFFPNEIDRIEGERSARPASGIWSGIPRLFEEKPAEVLSFLFAESKELAAEQVILVRDASQKEELLALIEDSCWQGNVLTIVEAKGLEFEDVVVFNMLSSSQIASQRLRFLLNFVSEVTVQEFDIRKHYELCHVLKELYVAVTRCKHRLLFVDGGCNERSIYAKVFQDLLQWTTIDKEMSFSRSSTIEDWACKAVQYQSAGLLPEARNAFFKAGQFDNATRVEAKILVAEFEASSDPKHILGAAELLVRINEIELAATHLYDAKQFVRAAELYEKLIPGHEQEIVECFILSGHYERSCDALLKYRLHLDPGTVIKIAVRLSRIISSKPVVTSSDFLVITNLLSCFSHDSATQLSAIVKNLEEIVPKFCQSSFDPNIFPKSGDEATVLAAFISILVKFRWIDQGVQFFQSRFTLEWNAAINELLKAAPALTESQEILHFRVLSILILERRIRDVPALKEVPKVSKASESARGRHFSKKARRDSKKTNGRWTARDSIISASSCPTYLASCITKVWRSLATELGEDVFSNLQAMHSDNSDSGPHRLRKCLYAGVSAITLALLSTSILELGEKFVDSIVLECIKCSVCHANPKWLQSASFLFAEAAQFLIQVPKLRTTAAFLFEAVGMTAYALSCFEHPGFEYDLLEKLKASENLLEKGFLTTKYSKLAVDFATKGENGPALFCIKKLPDAHSDHVKQQVFQIWLDNRRPPSRLPNSFDARALSLSFNKEILSVFDNISFLTKSDIAHIKECYDNISNPQATLEHPASGWFVQRVILWVLTALLPKEPKDLTLLTLNLSYIAHLRTGNSFNPQLDFRSIWSGFQLVKALSIMPDVSLSLVLPITNFLFDCSVVYVFLEKPSTGKVFSLRNQTDVYQYIRNECIETQACHVFNEMGDMFQRLREHPSAKHFHSISRLSSVWDEYMSKHKNIVQAIQFESKGDLSNLKRAASIYKKLGMRKTQNRLTRQITILEEENSTAQALANESRNISRNSEQVLYVPDAIDNDPSVSTHTHWSVKAGFNDVRVQETGRVGTKMILKKPEDVAEAS